MAEYTPKLNLLKKDPVVDGNDTFNIQTMLNDNWDKIDDFARAIEEGLGNVDDVGQAVGELIEQIGNLEELDTETKANLIDAINEIYQEIVAHKADYASKRFGDRPYTGRDDADMTYYIDAVNGDDSNDGLSSVTAFKTWAKVQALIPRFMGYSSITIRIIGNLPEEIVLENILAYGRIANRIRIIGDSLNADNHTVNGVGLYSIVGGEHNSVSIQGLTINGPCNVYGCVGVRVVSCNLRNNGGAGVDIIGSTATIVNCDFGTDIVQDCISAQYSLVLSDNNTGNGTRYGLRAANVATIGKFGENQPTGTIANERTTAGGEIL